MLRYIPFRERLYSDENKRYTAFGITIMDDQNNILLTVSDVFRKYSFAKKVCYKFTVGQLDLIHLYEVIDDYL